MVASTTKYNKEVTKYNKEVTILNHFTLLNIPRPQRRGHEDHADLKVEPLWSANPFQSLCCHPTSDSQSSAPRKSLLRFLVPAPLNFISFFNQLFSFSSSLSFFPFFLSVMKHKVSLRSYSSFLFLFFVLSVSWVIWL